MRLLIWLACLGMVGCGATRKISQVGLRDLASVQEANVFSELRQNASTLNAMAKSCPAEIKQLFPSISAELVKFPTCPDGLRDNFQLALPYLQIQERTTLEEVMNSQCRSMARGQFSDSVEGFYANFDSSGPNGRLKESGREIDPRTQSIMQGLKSGVGQLLQVHLPLDRWVEKNGSFILPEDDLRFLHRLFVDKKCKMASEEMELSYQSMRALEELDKISQDEIQKEKIDQFLNGVHRVIEQKIREYFYP